MPPKKKPPKGFLARIDPWMIIQGGPSHRVHHDPPPQPGHPSGSTSTSSTDRPLQVQAHRGDRPSYNPTSRGNLALALTAAESDDSKRRALDTLDSDVYASSSKRPRESYSKTWRTLHDAWFKGEVPELPLTVTKLRALGASFKRGGYRSISNSLAVMKDEHIALGYPWTDQLSRCAKHIDRSVTRGIGPGKQCVSIDLFKIPDLDLGGQALVANGPIGPANLAVASSFFMLREIEASLALWRSVEIDYEQKLITWNLPATKTDPRALGKSRSWGCVCPEGQSANTVPCPYHAIVGQRELVASTLGLDHPELESIPVFPTYTGETCEKAKVVTTAQAIATCMGMPPDRVKQVTGHYARISGAQHLARLGFDVVLIQLMARWSSDVVHHYIAEAPLGTITDKYRTLAAGKHLEEHLAQITTEVAELRASMANMVPSVSAAAEAEQFLHRAGSRDVGQPGIYAINPDSGKYHYPIDIETSTCRMVAKCGWVAEGGLYTRSDTLPRLDPNLICGMCLPRAKRTCSQARKQLSRAMHKFWDDVDCSSTSSSDQSSDDQ